MMEMSTGYEFEGPDGVVKLPDLFEGRDQLLLYHFWHPPDGDPCGGCSMFADQVSPLAHMHARDVSFALVSTAPQPKLQAFKERMGWEIPWYTVVGDDFQTARGHDSSTSSSTSTCAIRSASSSPTRPEAEGSRRSAASGPSST